MTIAVNPETGEIIEPISAGEAERLSMKISLRLDAIAENYATVMPMIREAIARGAHAALGYASPSAYISDRFGGALSRLGVEVRREVVRELTESGMSTRAIAPVVGVDHVTVYRDQRRVASATPQPEADAALEGALNAPPVTGIDGKTYTRPEPKASPRRALTEQFFDAAYDLTKVIERIERLAADDRFSQNAEKVAAKHRNDLLRSIDGLQAVVNRLPSA